MRWDRMNFIVISLLTLLPWLCNTVFAGNLALGFVAVQSSTYNAIAGPDNAVDGSKDTDFVKGSCTHTQQEDNPWWRVDLKQTYRIAKVVITNRGDCCGERIVGAQIHIGNSLQNNGNVNEVAATILTAPRNTATFRFEPVEGRYVNIFLPGTQKILSLCEVEVYSDNLALGADAVQSSTFSDSAGSNHAVDGNRDGDFKSGSCTHTTKEDNPWWRVDLNGNYKIAKVVIINRGDCCGERILGAEIRIGDSLDNNGNNNMVAATVLTAVWNTGTFRFDPIEGRYVNIFLPGTQKILSLCEVEVYIDNLALGVNAVQSSTYNQLAGANHAVDGNRDSDYLEGSCTHTKQEDNPWWRVDLVGIYHIKRVVITNRGDCCEERLLGAQIRIGNSLENKGNNNTLAATYETVSSGDTQTFTLAYALRGRYVNIFLPGTQKILSLCEVEVYSD